MLTRVIMNTMPATTTVSTRATVTGSGRFLATAAGADQAAGVAGGAGVAGVAGVAGGAGSSDTDDGAEGA